MYAGECILLYLLYMYVCQRLTIQPFLPNKKNKQMRRSTQTNRRRQILQVWRDERERINKRMSRRVKRNRTRNEPPFPVGFSIPVTNRLFSFGASRRSAFHRASETTKPVVSFNQDTFQKIRPIERRLITKRSQVRSGRE